MTNGQVERCIKVDLKNANLSFNILTNGLKIYDFYNNIITEKLKTDKNYQLPQVM